MATKKGKKSNKKQAAALSGIVGVILIVVLLVASKCIPGFDLGGLFGDGGVNNPPVGRTEGELTVTFINVGQGDSILIELPDGKNMLIDGGDRGSFDMPGNEDIDISDVVLSLLESKDISRLDYVMLTHTDADHCGSLDEIIFSDEVKVVDVYMPYVRSEYENDPLVKGTSDVQSEITSVLETPNTIDTVNYADFVESVVEEGANIYYSLAGMKIEGEGYRFTFITPEAELYKEVKKGNSEGINNVSPIMMLEYNDLKVMFTGDAAKEAEETFMENYVEMGLDVDCDVLKAGHHGSSGSSMDFFLNAVKPEYVVISAGIDNDYGHPHKEAMNRFAAVGAKTYCTQDCGNIVLKADANGFKFEAELMKLSSYKVVDPFGFSYLMGMAMGY